MAKFGRFEFGKQEPAETYEGDYMELDDKGYVRIFRGKADSFPALTFGAPSSSLVNAIHLDKGQSVREINGGKKRIVPSKRKGRDRGRARTESAQEAETKRTLEDYGKKVGS